MVRTPHQSARPSTTFFKPPKNFFVKPSKNELGRIIKVILDKINLNLQNKKKSIKGKTLMVWSIASKA